jgi:phosphate regulon transcriptional regulator PhoB
MIKGEEMPRDKILIVEDEGDIQEVIAYNLNKEGYGTIAAQDGISALGMARTEKPKMIILDIMLPEMDGLEVCRKIKGDPALSDIPIIMLTAKSEEIDKIVGLELGADDYMTKPFSPRELVARVKAVLRRSGERPAAEGEKLSVADLEIDTESYTVLKKGEPVELSSTEFRLLEYLARRKGKIFSRDQLLDAVWQDDSYVEPRTVDVHIRRLREKIEDDPSKPAYIKTRRGIGYYMSEEM